MEIGSSQQLSHLTHPKYRPDIDGLRAIAVLSVVIYHAFPGLIGGGFIGVDIFFVISGFLISTIIINSLERKNFSFYEFYSRRIGRIFPALILVLGTCFVLGWFTLIADEYKQLGKHIAGGAGFISNFLFLNESGYFDRAAETKPLLHLWSLGIEEQFYIIWPLLLWSAWKKKFNLLTVTFVVALISFWLNINRVHGDTIAAFYLPQTRFWELLVGATLACMTLQEQPLLPKIKYLLDDWLGKIIYAQPLESNGKILRDAQSLLGAILILTSLCIIKKEWSFPGWWAALPTFGTALIISAGANSWFNRAVLSSRILVWFGLISFPLYLWHWPILSFARIIQGTDSSPLIKILIILISIALAWLTYRIIERPIRFGWHGKVKTITLFTLMLAVGFVGFNTFKRDGLPFRMKYKSEFLAYFENERPEMRYFDKINLRTTWRRECAFFDFDKHRAKILKGTVPDSKPRESLDKSCFERDFKYEKSVLLWGDSHAQALAPGITKSIPTNWQFLQVATAACSPSIDSLTPSTESQCTQSNYFAMKTITDAKPDVVVVAQEGGHSIKQFENIANKLKSLGVGKVILVGPTPHWASDLPKLLIKSRLSLPRRMTDGLITRILELDSRFKHEFRSDASRKYASIIDVLCNAEGCLTYLGDDVKSGVTTWDYGHLTPVASEYLAKNLLVPLIIQAEQISP